ncbi:hypothetical protein BS78_08G023200 [Paspalum vaginatum]|nr:hypothetical protein BS78_08G023200 [Paspalum vaginatum]
MAEDDGMEPRELPLPVTTILPPSQHGFQEEQQEPRAQAVDVDDDGHSDYDDMGMDDVIDLDEILSEDHDDDQMLDDDEPPSLSAPIPLEEALQQVAASRLRFRALMRAPVTTMPHGEGGGYSNGGFGAVPASAAAVAGLEKLEFPAGSRRDGGAAEGSGAAAANAATGCMICFEEFVDGEEVSVMPCSAAHEFHTQCIAKWLGVSNVCPLCRHKLPAAQMV